MRRTAQFAVIAILSGVALICVFQTSPYLKNRLRDAGVGGRPVVGSSPAAEHGETERRTLEPHDGPPSAAGPGDALGVIAVHSWEHKIVDRSELSAGNAAGVDARGEAVKRLDAYGAERWELSASVGDALVFKRHKR